MRSTFFKLNSRDLYHGCIMAILTAVLSFAAQGFTFDLESLKAMMVAVVSGVAAYLLKNLASNSEGEILTPERDELEDKE